ncbi:MAG: methyltransferase domain-containing protein [Proteobacteria bacterium]|nr:methyltransferase domain-containing protein [Pseudomonadota bacterium]
MSDSIFLRSPVRIVDNIPIFSEVDSYVANYDDIASDHLDHLGRFHHSPFMVDDQIQQSEIATLRLVQKHLQPGARILDAGVGMGNLLKDVPVYDRYGVDIAIDYLKLAQRQGVTVAMAKLVELPYIDGYFDGVVVCDVLEHLIDLDASVAQLARVLKPDGILIVRVPNNENLSSYVEDTKYSFGHVRTFSRESLRLYVEKCFGFSFVECDYCAKSFYSANQIVNSFPTMKAPIRSILPRLTKAAEARGAPFVAALAALGKGLVSSLEEQVDALILLRDEHPDVFAELTDSVLQPAELLGVFRAPHG